MTLEQLIASFRVDADDLEVPHLFKYEWIAAWLSEAQAEADESKAKKKRLEADTLVDVDLMDKDQLSSFAKENYGVKLDKRSSIEGMRAKAHELVLGTGVVA